MLADPLVVNVTASALTLATPLSFAASERNQGSSIYRYSDSELNDHKIIVSHQYGRTRNRFVMRYDVAGIQPNSLAPTENVTFSQSVYCVADVPFTGYVNTTGSPNLFRNMMMGIGGQMLAVAVDPVFLARVVKLGET